MRCERCGESAVRVGVNVPATLLCAKYGISESLRGLVGELAGSERLDPCFSLVESALRGTSCAIQLFPQLIDESHCRLVLK
jgi:hypothetical protein